MTKREPTLSLASRSELLRAVLDFANRERPSASVDRVWRFDDADAVREDVRREPLSPADRIQRGDVATVRHALARLTDGRLAGPVVLPDDWRAQRGRDRASAAKELREMQRQVRKLLADVVDSRAAAPDSPLAFAVGEGVPTGRAAVALRAGADGAIVPHVLAGTLRNRVILAAVLLLSRESDQTIGRCPMCGRYFLQTGRQAYCGRPCANRATWATVKADAKRLESYRRKQYAAYGWSRGARGAGSARAARAQ